MYKHTHIYVPVCAVHQAYEKKVGENEMNFTLNITPQKKPTVQKKRLSLSSCMYVSLWSMLNAFPHRSE